MKSVELSMPVMSQMGELRSIELRAPRAADLIDLGMPYHVARCPDGIVVVVQDEIVLATYINRLAATRPASVRDLALTDLLQLNHAVLEFFIEAGEAGFDEQSWSTLIAQRERLARDRQTQALIEMKPASPAAQ